MGSHPYLSDFVLLYSVYSTVKSSIKYVSQRWLCYVHHFIIWISWCKINLCFMDFLHELLIFWDIVFDWFKNCELHPTVLFTHRGMKSRAGFMEAPAFLPSERPIPATQRPISREPGTRSCPHERLLHIFIDYIKREGQDFSMATFLFLDIFQSCAFEV